MAGISNLVSYDLKGVKESFANWISNISPADTPFTSMTGKESIKNKFYQWQEDRLGDVDKNNAAAEGSDAVDAVLTSTLVQKNVTQILRKVVQVSDTADSVTSYGRGKELQYQLEKAGKELKRDIEYALLNNDTIVEGSATVARQTGGFPALVAPKGTASPEDKTAIVHDGVKTVGTVTEEDIFKITTALYLAGAKACVIMYHPKFAPTFASMMEKYDATNGATRVRMFNGVSDEKINKYVTELVDPLGQRFGLIPNRFMPEDKIYFFCPADWTQMVLRQPGAQHLDKTGSYEKYMIEIELGLRHRNRFASGILDVGTGSSGGGSGGSGGSGSGSEPTSVTITGTGVTGNAITLNGATTATLTITPVPAGSDVSKLIFSTQPTGVVTVTDNHDGTVTLTGVANGTGNLYVQNSSYHDLGSLSVTVTGKADTYFENLVPTTVNAVQNTNTAHYEVVAVIGTDETVTVASSNPDGLPLGTVTAVVPTAGQATATTTVNGSNVVIHPVAKGTVEIPVVAKGHTLTLKVTVVAAADRYVKGKSVATAAAGALVPIADLFDFGTGANFSELSWSVDGDSAQGTMAATGLTIADTAVAPVIVTATNYSSFPDTIGTPAVAKVLAVTPKP